MSRPASIDWMWNNDRLGRCGIGAATRCRVASERSILIAATLSPPDAIQPQRAPRTSFGFGFVTRATLNRCLRPPLREVAAHP
jgi:hypothetical protein